MQKPKDSFIKPKAEVVKSKENKPKANLPKTTRASSKIVINLASLERQKVDSESTASFIDSKDEIQPKDSGLTTQPINTSKEYPSRSK